MGWNTDLILIVDESGSMKPTRQVTINSINELVQDQKAKPGNLAISQFHFNSMLHSVRKRQRGEDFDYLTLDDYIPHGGTRLVDSAIEVLDEAEAWPMPTDHSAIVVIVTDGEDNASKRPASDLKERVQALEAKGWKFVFIGSGIDAVQTGNQYGISRSMQADLTSAHGTQSAYRSLALTVTSLRSEP